jgi:peptidoglycan/LPS O-acetylase OafA/YrhL
MFQNVQIGRGLAALAVVLAHVNLFVDKTLFSGVFIIGWSGVDFFFVLSGFIIFYTSYGHFGDLAYLREYVRKRFVRVFPVYWLYTAIVLAIDCALFYAVHKHLLGWAELTPVGVLSDLFLLPTNMGINDAPILPPAWTLTYEVFFYAAFGLLLIAGKRAALAIVAAWVCLIVAASFGFRNDPLSFLYVAGNPRNFEFLMGCAAGYILSMPLHPSARYIGFVSLIVGCLLLAAAWTNAQMEFAWHAKMDALHFGVPYFLIVLGIALIDKTGSAYTGLVGRAAIGLGNASYSIYLVHFLVVIICVAIASRLGLPSIVSFFVISAVALGAGLVAYRYVERPLLLKMSRKRKAPAAAVMPTPALP